MILQNRRLTVILLTVLTLLSIPFIAMQFTREVNWTAADFVAAAVLLLTAGLAFELIMRKVKKRAGRVLMSVAVLLILVLCWVELAVGIFGTPLAGN